MPGGTRDAAAAARKACRARRSATNLAVGCLRAEFDDDAAAGGIDVHVAQATGLGETGAQ